MCFTKPILKGSMHLQAKIATRPIRVLKVGKPIDDEFVKGGFMSIMYPKLYLPNVVCKQPSLDPYIEEHYYFRYSCYLNIERGFHSYRHTNGHTEALVKFDASQYCIGIFEIPTGSIYYYNGAGCYVSDAIKLLKVVNTKKEWEKINFQPEQILL